MNLRPERSADALAVRAVLTAAFPTDAEARLVEKLRANDNATIALVAELEGAIVGHCLFSPVIIDGDQRRHGLGLAPVAVLPDWQGRGIGGLLIAAGIDEARRRKVPFVVVLGHAGYYPRFGFERADVRGVGNQFGATATFFVLELQADGVPVGSSVARYGPEFGEFEA